jgi:hypothetical protein
MQRRLVAVTYAFAVVSIGCAECHYYPVSQRLDDDFKEAAKALDNLKWYADAYGNASLSTPLLVQPDDTFKFNLVQGTPDSFFSSEKNEITGREAGALASAQMLGAGLTGSADLATMQQYLTSLATYRQNQVAIVQKQKLQNEAALQQYTAAVQSAQTIADPVQEASALASAKTQLEQSLAGPASDATNPLPTSPAPPGLPAPAQTANPAAAALGPFAPPQTLYGPGTPVVSGGTRSALLMAAGDAATNAMLSLLGDASRMTKFKGKRVLFGVSMVSLDPGWRTEKRYSADLQGRLRYQWSPARPVVRDAFLARKSDAPVEEAALQQLQSCVATSLPVAASQTVAKKLKAVDLEAPDKRTQPVPFDRLQFAPYVYSGATGSPVVASVSPMNDAQALDLQSSIRNTRQRALQMAVWLRSVGLSAQANAFTAFAKQQQKDLETRTNNVVVSAYSATSGTFGFRMYPQVAANPDDGKTRDELDDGDDGLEVPTFPALLIIGADDEELRPRVLVFPGPEKEPPVCAVVEPQLEFLYGTRWAPLDEPCLKGRPCPNGCKDSPCRGGVLTEEARFEVTGEVRSRLIQPMNCILKEPDSQEDPCKSVGRPRRSGLDCDSERAVAKFFLEQAELLISALNGTEQSIYLPPEFLEPGAKPQPTADAIAPLAVTLERDGSGKPEPKVVQMIIAGDDLDQIDLTKLSVVVGDISWLTEPKVDAVTSQPNVKLVGKSLQLLFRVQSDVPLVFNLPVKHSDAAIHSRPLVVYPPKDLVIERTSKKDAKGADGDAAGSK